MASTLTPGTPVAAEQSSEWVPTRKVVTAAIVAVALFIISRFTEVDKDTEQLINILAPLLAAYLVRNKRTIEGKGL